MPEGCCKYKKQFFVTATVSDYYIVKLYPVDHVKGDAYKEVLINTDALNFDSSYLMSVYKS